MFETETLSIPRANIQFIEIRYKWGMGYCVILTTIYNREIVLSSHVDKFDAKDALSDYSCLQ